MPLELMLLKDAESLPCSGTCPSIPSASCSSLPQQSKYLAFFPFLFSCSFSMRRMKTGHSRRHGEEMRREADSLKASLLCCQMSHCLFGICLDRLGDLLQRPSEPSFQSLMLEVLHTTHSSLPVGLYPSLAMASSWSLDSEVGLSS